jgi:hypothetical protein
MSRLLLASRSLLFANVDTAFEVCAILDHDALSDNITCKNCGLPQLDSISACDIAIYSTLDHDLFGIDVRANASVRTDCEVVIVEFNAAFNFSVYVQIFTSRKFTLDHHGFADMSNIGPTLLVGSIRIHETDLLTSLAGRPAMGIRCSKKIPHHDPRCSRET